MKNMLHLFFVCCLLCSIQTPAYSAWLSSIKQAKKIAQIENKLILVSFWSEKNQPSLFMEQEVWKDYEIIVLKSLFIPVKIEINRQKEMARRYRILSSPVLLILDSTGEEIYRNVGKMSKEEVKSLFLDIPNEVSSLYESLAIFKSERKNPYAHYMAGRGYQVMGNKLAGKVREMFIDKSEEYYRSCLRLSDDDQDAVLIEKVKLLRILNQLISGKAEKGVKKMEKDFNPQELHRSNKALAIYILMNGYNLLKDEDKTKALLKALKKTPGGFRYVKNIYGYKYN